MFKKIISLTLSVQLLSFVFYAAFEPAIIQAASAADQVQINQTVTSGISITSPSDITLTALSTSQNTAVASTTWTVITNNATGFSLAVTASSTAGAPALRKTDGTASFADYPTTTPTTWSVTNAFKFGFSAIGAKTTGYGSDAESNCAAGTDVQSAGLLWRGFGGQGIGYSYEIASSTATTTQSGVTTTFCVGTEQNGVFAPSGTYQATTTATATTNP